MMSTDLPMTENFSFCFNTILSDVAKRLPPYKDKVRILLVFLKKWLINLKNILSEF